ncbi:substrate-binding domain-containing protein [Sulfobacillus thermosulfidooxidans]|uniref:substrate-binding domain-containing protein n=1 Tax=Sulfobacillus thermosulfidooxidans TaxID=28034 RepID=UPI0006B4B83C|nr:substrate-binding domain-containing protein [Sulfobacillus thermosulfidooxidans]
MISRRQFVMGILSGPLLYGALRVIHLLRTQDPILRLTIMGASSCMGYVKAVLPNWERGHSRVHVAISGGGSYAGLKAIANGQVEMAIADVIPPPGYIVVPLRRYSLGRIPIVIVAHSGVGIKRLSWQQARQVFQGLIQNWRQIGGQDVPIVVVSRPLSSGAREVVQTRLLAGSEFSPHAIIQLSNGAVAKTVRETPGAIGYVEAVMPLDNLHIMCLGNHCYQRNDPGQWVLFAEPAIFIREDAEPLVVDLAEYLAHDPSRPAFGIYPEPTQGGAS